MAKGPTTLLVFDVDGTLLVNGRALREIFGRAYVEAAGAVPERSDEIRFSGMTDRGIVRALRSQTATDLSYDELFDGFQRRYLELVEQHYPVHPEPHLLPGVVELLESLARQRDVAMVLGTGNIRRSAELKLQRFGLEGYFQAPGQPGSIAGGFGGDHEQRADVIRAALQEGRERLDWSGENAWVIGDTPRDIEAARAAGAKVLAVATGNIDRSELAEHKPDLLVDDLRDTAGLLASLGLA